MQLKRLYIKEYKILKDFTLEFPYDSKKYISVFIGANGSGKSTVLEAVAEIFNCVFLFKQSPFDFEIEYSIKSDDILSVFSISNPKLKRLPIKITGDSGYLPRTEIDFKSIPKEIFEYGDTDIKLSFAQRDFRNLMPENVVIYYSGLSDIMKELCKPYEDRLSEAYRKGNANIDRGFFYYKPEHFGIILLSLLSFEYGDIPEFLKRKAKIEDIESVQIHLKKPGWTRDSIENFWGAEGEVRRFLDFLREQSKTDKSIGIKTGKGEKIAISLKGKESLYKIRDFLIEEKKLFEILNIMLADGLLDNISFSMVKMSDGKPQVFSILSEGEQQAITIKGLTELLSGKNTLFLFDEPDTYLHPKWQRQFIAEIEKTIENANEAENSYVIATHSPQLLSNAKSDLNFVKIIENGVLIENTPKFYGREISSILYNLMGVEERNKTIRNDLSNLFTLIEDEEIEEAEKELKRLTEILGETDPDIKNIEIQLNYLKEDEADNKE